MLACFLEVQQHDRYVSSYVGYTLNLNQWMKCNTPVKITHILWLGSVKYSASSLSYTYLIFKIKTVLQSGNIPLSENMQLCVLWRWALLPPNCIRSFKVQTVICSKFNFNFISVTHTILIQMCYTNK